MGNAVSALTQLASFAAVVTAAAALVLASVMLASGGGATAAAKPATSAKRSVKARRQQLIEEDDVDDEEELAARMPAARTRAFTSPDQVLEVARALADYRDLPQLLEETRSLEVFTHAAMVNDIVFFNIAFCHLPLATFADHVKRRNRTNDMTLLESCDVLFPELAERIKRHLKRQQQLMRPHVGAAAASMTFAQLTGNRSVIKTLQRNIAAMKSDSASAMNLQPLLLHGPPGTGKSYLALCCAVEMQAPVLEIKCQDALSSKLGESEKLVAQQFALAASSEPKAVVIINEFESLCRRNKSSETAEWTATIRKCFIDIFDNLRDPEHEYFGIKVVLTTNFLSDVDAAVCDRVEKIEVPLPSQQEICELLPVLCRKHVAGLDVSRVDWQRAATLAHRRLSIRGLKDALEKGYRQLLDESRYASAPAPAPASVTSELVCEWMRRQIGKVPPEPLKQLANYKLVTLASSVQSEKVTLATRLARVGWRFDSAPSSVYRQIFTLEGVSEGSVLILKKAAGGGTDQYLTGIGCYATLKDEASSDIGFKSHHVYIQCRPEDAGREVCARTTSVLLESYGQIGVRPFSWQFNDKFVDLGAMGAPTTVENFLAPLMKRFVSGRVYVESHSKVNHFGGFSTADVSAKFDKILVYRGGDEERLANYVTGEQAKLLVGNAKSPDAMNELGYRVFFSAESSAQVVSSGVSVLYASQYDDGAVLTKLETEARRFIVCPETGATVADALRRNGIHYAALHGVFVRRTQPATASSSTTLYAVTMTSREQLDVWTGPALAHFETLPSFGAKYTLFSPCTGARQVLNQGVTIMVDMNKINELPTPERPLSIALLRLYPEEANGRVIRDFGYEDNNKISRGFRRGWYRGNYYWRIVGDGDAAFLSGGTAGNPYEKNISRGDDLGYDHTGILVDIPGHGICFCRGVGNDSANPDMACVLFDAADSHITDKYAFIKQIGTWADVCQ